jgi:hypothetical protein
MNSLHLGIWQFLQGWDGRFFLKVKLNPRQKDSDARDILQDTGTISWVHKSFR